ncbi:MAG: hypothetical protein EPN97_00755 [Alphaproteobacteria bacterium]|nr:MAG: hypothetical protein EPN97_00755 [Alphaproteobacteria bacterium]
MLDNLKKKFKDFKLRDIFKRKAGPPIPQELLDNKPLQKAIVKRHRRKVLKRLGGIFMASAMLSTGLQYTPGLVSVKFDDFMAGRGYADNLSQHFHTGEIRVYDRFNPLYPFHRAGREVAIEWHENMKISRFAAIPLAVATPFIYWGGLTSGFGDMLPGSELDAYSMANNDKPADRVNFIRPPGEFSLNSFLADFSGVDGGKLTFKNDRQDLRDVLFAFTMLHEARHGDQEKLANANANESDADLYAFKVLQARGVDPALLREAATIVAHARTLNAVLGGDASHVSTFTLQRGSGRIFDGYQDAAAFKRLHDVLGEADVRNDLAFPPRMPAGQRYLYLTLAMEQEGLLDEDAGMKKAAVAYVNAINYFNNASGGAMIDPKFDMSKIDLSYLTQKYKPVPDKLNVPAAAPKAPKPNS